MCTEFANSLVACFLKCSTNVGVCFHGIKSPRHLAPWKKNKSIVVCLIGFENSGKTTIIKAVKGENIQNIHPTVGFCRNDIEIRGYKITVYDIGGGEKIRSIWSNYFAEVHGIVYVVNSSLNKLELDNNKKMLEKLSDQADIKGKPILILLNKKDILHSIDEVEFSNDCKLHLLAKKIGAVIRVESTNGTCGIGKNIDLSIVDGFEWLINQILLNYTLINDGVKLAVENLKQKQRTERIKRQHRLAMLSALNENNFPDNDNESKLKTFNNIEYKENFENDNANESFYNVAEEMKINKCIYDPPTRVQRVIDQVKKQKLNRVVPTTNLENASLNEFTQNATFGYYNEAFDMNASMSFQPNYDTDILKKNVNIKCDWNVHNKTKKCNIVEKPKNLHLMQERKKSNWDEVKSI